MSSRTSHRRSTRGEYIETDTGNKVSRRSKIEGTPHIILGGRVVVQAEVCLRGDLCRPASAATTTPTAADGDAAPAKEPSRTAISVGRYTMLSTGATLHPPHRTFRGGEIAHYPMKLGENVFVGPGAFVSAASIGNFVHIGRNATIGNGCVIKDCVKVLDGAILPAGMVVPSGVVVGGRPAKIIGDLPDGWGVAGGGNAAAGDGGWVEGGELRELIRSVK